MHGRRQWQPIPVFLPGEFRDGGAWWAAVCGVAELDRTEAMQQQQAALLQVLMYHFCQLI